MQHLFQQMLTLLQLPQKWTLRHKHSILGHKLHALGLIATNLKNIVFFCPFQYN